MSRLKIVFVSYNSGRVLRGGEIAVDEYSKRLAKVYDVCVIQGGEQRSKKYPTIIVKTKPNWKGKDFSGTIKRFFFVDPRSLAIAKFSLSAICELKKIDPDVVVPVNDGWESVIFRIWSVLKRKKIIFIGSSGKSWESVVNLALFPHLFIALTNNVSSWAKKVNPFVNTATISNGVDTNLFKPSKSIIKTKLEKPIYLGVGSISKQKNWEALIRAVNKLKKGSVLLIGQGPDENFIDAKGFNLLGKNRYQRITKLPHSQLVDYYNLCHVFSMPSDHSEGQGIVYLEAMACNKPVVATSDPQRVATIQKGGILIDPKDINKCAKALHYAFMYNWGNIPRKIALQASWDKVVLQFVEAVKAFKLND